MLKNGQLILFFDLKMLIYKFAMNTVLFSVQFVVVSRPMPGPLPLCFANQCFHIH